MYLETQNLFGVGWVRCVCVGVGVGVGWGWNGRMYSYLVQKSDFAKFAMVGNENIVNNTTGQFPKSENGYGEVCLRRHVENLFSK